MLTEGDYTTQSFFSVSAPDSFETFCESNDTLLESQELMISKNTPLTPSYPSASRESFSLIESPKFTNKTSLKMSIPLPSSPPESPFLKNSDGSIMKKTYPQI